MTTISSDVPAAWVVEAVERCLALCRRSVGRYGRHLRQSHLCRDPLDDLLALAARRVAPLSLRVVRPLPGLTLPASARAFNALDRADRRVLLALFARAPSPPIDECAPTMAAAHGEHQASALGRLVEGTRSRESHIARTSRRALQRQQLVSVSTSDRRQARRANLRERPQHLKEPRPPP